MSSKTSSKQGELSKWVGGLVGYKEGALTKKDVLLVLNIVDDSSSIPDGGNTGFVVDGYTWFLESLQEATADIRVGTIFLNKETTLEFVPAKKAVGLLDLGYSPHGSTPLYKRVRDGLIALAQEVQRLTAQGFIVRTMTFIFTDGGDNVSRPMQPEDLFPMITMMIATQMHIVGGCGVFDGCTNFRDIFARMGIPEAWIKVLSEGKEIKQSFKDMGTSVSQASTDGQTFTEMTMTGFVKPQTGSSGSGSSSSKKKT